MGLKNSCFCTSAEPVAPLPRRFDCGAKGQSRQEKHCTQARAHLVTLQQCGQELVRGAGEERRILNLLGQNLLLQHAAVLGAEGRIAGQHLEQQDANAPPVSALHCKGSQLHA